MVARVKLQQMRQDRDEPVRAFAARLRGQAGVCSFSIKCLSDTCGSSVDYSDIMIRDALIRGLDDEEIRLDILGESRQDLSLEDTLSYVEAKESGKRSASHLIGDSSINTAAAMSSYKRHEKVRAQSNPTENKGSSATLLRQDWPREQYAGTFKEVPGVRQEVHKVRHKQSFCQCLPAVLASPH